MTLKTPALVLAAVFSFALCASAQSFPRPGGTLPPVNGTSATPNSTTNSTARNGRREACLRQAGISRTALEKHRSIAEEARSRIQSVCQDTSLSNAQKKEQIKKIHQEAKQRQEGLLNSQQLSVLRSCDRNAHAGGSGVRTPSGDPCSSL